MREISCTERVKNEVTRRVKEECNILYTVKRRKNNWVGHILRKDLLSKTVTEGKIEVTGRRERRHKQLLDDLKKINKACTGKRKH